MAPVLKILSLDGGHGRDTSGLQILQRLLEKIKETQSFPEVPRPCELFDLIGGTGTGGTIRDVGKRVYNIIQNLSRESIRD
ncbi:putative patatin-like serine protein [Eutypa lata UCREL1]|uniref:Putative patatin-like serine protein n=1 Tax=Eutypa lata (strain UCR-EL1) TaxID=1287681 RepID=M7TKC4_EUTLA|nr:putative patatin-like serine protein [Eutypa lata UCREL1]